MATGRIPTTANSPLTVKGDLFGYSTTQARVPVGNDGETLVADSSTSTGLSYQANWAAGKNKIINGDMRIWQRGTSLSNAGVVYGADRWQSFSYSGSSSTIAQQTFTPGTAPVAGYEGQFFLRITSTNTQTIVWQNIEDVRAYAGQTVTVSFWAKVASAVNLGASISQQFGSGGSSAVNTTITLASAGATTSWQRFTGTVAVPSISGKTIGTSSYLQLNLFHVGINNALDIWGVQLEAGSTATAFQTATGTIQGELAACQRYFQKKTFGLTAACYDSTNDYFNAVFLVSPTMRVSPTLGNVTTSSVQYVTTLGNLANTTTILTSGSNGPDYGFIIPTITALGTVGQAAALLLTDITFSSEL